MIGSGAICRRLRRGASGIGLVVAALCTSTASVHAHERGSSQSSWQLGPGDVHVTLTVSDHELADLGETAAADAAFLAEYVTGQLSARTPEGACSVTPGSLRSLTSQADGRTWEWHLRCPGGSRLIIDCQLFARTAPKHLHFVHVTSAGRTTHHVLREGQRSVEVSIAESRPGEGFGLWLGLGVQHILGGHDHLAFLLALLIGAASLGALAWTLSGFTLGHALTLALAALGHLHANTRLVEALIGASIVVVAVANVSGHRPSRVAARARSTGMRTVVATGFGLVHGLGFASALGEHGLPQDDLVPALVGFNLGVELGQLCVVTVVWALLVALGRRRAPLRGSVLAFANAVVCASGVYWTITRLI